MAERRPAGGIRTVTVRSPSALRELRTVAIVVAQIAFVTAFAIAAGADRESTGSAPKAEVQFDTVVFSSLDSDDQRLYRRALEGLAEAEDVRSQTGAWPTVLELAARKLPPFAEDPIDRHGYRWHLVAEKHVVNYIGIPTAPGRSTFVIVAQEPLPGEVDPFAVDDETHDKLATGLMIHVGVWRGPNRDLPTRPYAIFAYQDGWRRVTNGR